VIRRQQTGGFSYIMQSAEVVVFPVDRRGAFIQLTVRELNNLHGEAANVYWRGAARALYQELTAQGLDDATARAEVNSFSERVQSELRQQAMQAPALITA